MEKENKLATEQETKENEIVELKDNELSMINAGELVTATGEALNCSIFVNIDDKELCCDTYSKSKGC